LTKVLVTGAGGYVGGRLVGTLLKQGSEVHALVRDPAPRLGVDETVCDLASDDVGPIRAACEGVDAIVHLAGENEVMAAQQPALALAGTLVATERLVEEAQRAGVKRLIYMSTVHVYGQRMRDGAVLTEDLRLEPRSTYAISRLASEHVAAMLNGDGSDLVVFRLTNSVGAPDHPEVDRWTLVANDLCRQGATTGRLELRSSGVQWRDFVALSDVCSIVATAARVENPALPAGTYNLGSGRPTTVRGLAEMVQDAFERSTGTRPELHAPEPGPERPEPYHVAVQAMADHGLEGRTPLEDAVEETVRFCLDHREELS
jgi:UDP-glucose 4-epimerase